MKKYFYIDKTRHIQYLGKFESRWKAYEAVPDTDMIIIDETTAAEWAAAITYILDKE